MNTLTPDNLQRLTDWIAVVSDPTRRHVVTVPNDDEDEAICAVFAMHDELYGRSNTNATMATSSDAGAWTVCLFGNDDRVATYYVYVTPGVKR